MINYVKSHWIMTGSLDIDKMIWQHISWQEPKAEAENILE